MPDLITTVFPESATSNPGFDRYAPLLTVQDLKERYLHGVILTDNRGVGIKRRVYQFWIDQAISQVEHALEATIVPTTYNNEEYDYRYEEYAAWSFIQLRHKPIITDPVVQLRLTKENAFTTLPTEWVRCEKHAGQIQLVPTAGTLGMFNIGDTSFLPRTLLFNVEWPCFFRVSYTAGYELNRLPVIIAQLIGILAALQALNVARDLVLGAGIGSTSISMDGLSQTVASHLPYAAKIKQYQDEAKELLATLRGYYGKRVKVAIC